MKDCIFCKIASGQANSWKVFENDSVCAFFDYNPVNPYHTLVIPKKHYCDIFEIDETDLIEVTKAIKKIAVMYKEKLGINNIQVLSSSGHEAQQDVFHLHFHIIPRHSGDGQNIVWTPRAEVRKKFDKLLADFLNN